MKKILILLLVLSFGSGAYSQITENCTGVTIDNSVSEKRVRPDLCSFNVLLNPSAKFWLGIADEQTLYIYPRDFDENNLPEMDVEYCNKSVLKVDSRIIHKLTVHTIIEGCQVVPIEIPLGTN